MPCIRSWTTRAAIAGALLGAATAASAAQFAVLNLVTDDQSAHAAQITDPGLINAWGISYAPTGPFWISSNGAGTSTLYKVDPLTQATTKLGLTVTLPGAGSVTGQVFNAAGSGAFGGNTFLFTSEDGTVSGWKSGTSAATPIATLSAVYKGAALATIAGNGYLYAADFHGGAVNVFKGSVGAPSLADGFVDPSLPAGYAPFNVQVLNSSLYVTYAVQDAEKHDEMAGAGLGLVDQYDLQGHLLARIATGGTLNAPWGLAIAPSSFGTLAGDLLVGNFGDGRISAFDPVSHAFAGQVLGADGQPLSIDGLWALSVGNGVQSGSKDLLYFTAGPDNESHGLFGVLTPVPEPATHAMLLLGLAGLLIARRRA